ncbi:sensor histidine kinase [Cellulosimicrobium terreum]|nr:sensor histidine kinase [Cellulosimicrobium terreum]
MSEPTLVLLCTVAALGWLAAGLVCLRRPGARSFALLAMVGGGLLACAAVGGAGGASPDIAGRVGLAAALGVLPMALVEYPSRGPREIRLIALPVLGAVTVLVVLLGPGATTLTLQLVVGCTVIGAVWWRFERAGAAERETVLWLVVVGGTAGVVSIPLAFLGPRPWVVVVLLLVLVGVPAGCAAGILGPPPLDVRAVVVRVAATGTTLLVAVATFTGLVSLAELGTAPRESVPVGVLGIAALVVAAGFHPVLVLLQGVFDRLVRGEPVDSVSTALRFGTELSGAEDPTAALDALRTTLGLPGAALESPMGTVRWTSGDPAAGAAPGRHHSVDLLVSGVPVGRLDLTLRDGESAPRSTDRAVLGIVAPALALALHARQLAEDLATSREQVVTSVEDHRRRLRAELHDGLGPTLTGVAYAADAARNLARSDPDATVGLLADLRADVGQAIVEIRRIVDGLSPAVLDELGLESALRRHAVHLHTASGERLTVRLDIGTLPALSAATEVAVYRIVTEALTNVARHAGARTATVTVAVRGPALVAEVHDDGAPAPPTDWQPGVGLTSMRARTEELGGSLEVGATSAGGRVRAALPLD